MRLDRTAGQTRVGGKQSPFVKAAEGRENVAWKHAPDEGICAALPTSLFATDPLRLAKLGRLFGLDAASRAKSCEQKQGKKDRRRTRIYARRGGSEQRDKEAHLDDFLVGASGSGREESGDAAAERARQLQSPARIWRPRTGLLEPRGAGYTRVNFFLRGLDWFGGVFRGPEPRIGGLFPPAPRSVGPGEFRERGPTRPLQSRLPSNDAFRSRRKIPAAAGIAIVTAD